MPNSSHFLLPGNYHALYQTTLLRFDAVHQGRFKTNKKRLIDYPNLWAYTR
jgi:glutathionyl-hydroquinone reductase